jgi:3-dehydroquinate synthase
MNTSIIYTGEEQQLHSILDTKNIVVIADARTNGFCLFVAHNLIPALHNARLIVIPAGEENKTLEVVEFIWQQMQNISVNKSWIVVNLGGGMVCDMGGFACATYMRGIPFINIPTTLLAMNDASFGGKTGFNFGNIKNNIGVFSNPKFVYINPIFLNTISDRHIANGAVESIKHALIHDANLWNKYLQIIDLKEFANLENIKKSVAIKQHFVSVDEHDENERQALNFGHSIGHAIEALQLNVSHQLLHGEAVLLGMMVELKLSEAIYGLDEKVRKNLQEIKNKFYPTITFSGDKKTIVEKILFDKKNSETINMSLLKNIGEPVIKTPISIAQITAALEVL